MAIVYFPELPTELVEMLQGMGLSPHRVEDLSAVRDDSGILVYMLEDPGTAVEALRSIVERDSKYTPQVLLIIATSQLEWLERAKGLFDDWCFYSANIEEVALRANFLFGRTSGTAIKYGPLEINVDSYQATVNGQLLDLTYMEYKLLAFLATNPEKVFSREALLTRVWGYDYYGGARTVDVHIRRLRSKMGDRHANMISTIRSVGYMLTTKI